MYPAVAALRLLRRMQRQNTTRMHTCLLPTLPRALPCSATARALLTGACTRACDRMAKRRAHTNEHQMQHGWRTWHHIILLCSHKSFPSACCTSPVLLLTPMKCRGWRRWISAIAPRADTTARHVLIVWHTSNQCDQHRLLMLSSVWHRLLMLSFSSRECQRSHLPSRTSLSDDLFSDVSIRVTTPRKKISEKAFSIPPRNFTHTNMEPGLGFAPSVVSRVVLRDAMRVAGPGVGVIWNQCWPLRLDWFGTTTNSNRCQSVVPCRTLAQRWQVRCVCVQLFVYVGAREGQSAHVSIFDSYKTIMIVQSVSIANCRGNSTPLPSSGDSQAKFKSNTFTNWKEHENVCRKRNIPRITICVY